MCILLVASSCWGSLGVSRTPYPFERGCVLGVSLIVFDGDRSNLVESGVDSTDCVTGSPDYRIVFINRPQPSDYLTNHITTAKYTKLSFLPSFLFEQFRRYSNCFFLFIALLQQIPDVSPTGRFTTLVPLIFILLVSALKEIVEDYKRHVADRETNHREVEVLKDGNWQWVTWENVEVGNIVKVQNNQFFPADLIVLSTSEPQGMCYIETMNLDGETNLKIRQSPPETSNLLDARLLSDFRACIECEHPNKLIYEFNGALKESGKQSVSNVLGNIFTLCRNLRRVILEIQATFINQDLDMYHEETDTPAMARTSNLNEELGMVKYIFSDKTGTLTRNVMEFKRCSVAGKIFECIQGSSQQTSQPPIIKDLKQNDAQSTVINHFLRMMAVCHTVIPEKLASGEIVYHASSPDERALLQGARDYGFVFDTRTPNFVEILCLGKREKYEILNVIEFTSARKRMSIICRNPEGKYLLFCKYTVTTVCLKAGLHTAFWTVFTHLSIWGSIAAWLIMIAVYSHAYPLLPIGEVMSGMDVICFSSLYFWLGLFLIPIAILVPDLSFIVFQRTLFKSLPQAVRESEINQNDPASVMVESKHSITERARLLKGVKSVFNLRSTTQRPPVEVELSHGFAFSQEEGGAVPQSDVIRAYNTNTPKPSGM
ncbi:unnamed protein product [Nesidiocoris tenuis]|uniref:P-type phospholipid transporter n=1 Tax=Nesidiocoris tenuis TaxID=355587 RepID=A0A6H5H7N9_9HEMI|nr:unnamed protein product [Nesidiocoris tenuis]